MRTEEGHYVIEQVRDDFEKIMGGKGKKMPAILSICSDLMDISAKNDANECKAVRVRCEDHNCKKGNECKDKDKKFYIYNEIHSLFWKNPELLPEELRITSSRTKKEKRKKLSDNYKLKDNKEQYLVKLKSGVIIYLYKNENWEECTCPMDSYKDILASLFFFCPQILWCAITDEMKGEEANKYVLHAIRRCLDLYIFLDKIERENENEICYYAEETILKISNMRKNNAIEAVLYDSRITDLPTTDRIVRIVDTASMGLQYICDKMSVTTLEKRKARKIMEKNIYGYLYKYSKKCFL